MPCNQNQSALPFRILIAPLDWGLGHATRCIPVIRYFIEKGHEVTIAASGATAVLLKQNFPGVLQLPLPGYDITYSRSGGTFVVKLLSQIPKILRAIRRERQWLREMHTRHAFDLVVSDNRYGLKIDGLKSVIMTHQLQIMTGFGPAADYIMRKLHYRMLQKFDECWVVDDAENGGLAGALSHPRLLPAHARYLGLLSQLPPPATQPTPNSGILVLLSGPEPMRSLLESQILTQITAIGGYHFHIIAGNPKAASPSAGVPAAGVPAETPTRRLPAHVTYATHADARELAAAFSAAELVICRSGYSTLMDLAVFEKKALLIPTPGQSEQEYLAGHLQAQGIALSKRQAEIDLRHDIAGALRYPGFKAAAYTRNAGQMQKVIDDSLEQLENW